MCKDGESITYAEDEIFQSMVALMSMKTNSFKELSNVVIEKPMMYVNNIDMINELTNDSELTNQLIQNGYSDVETIFTMSADEIDSLECNSDQKKVLHDIVEHKSSSVSNNDGMNNTNKHNSYDIRIDHSSESSSASSIHSLSNSFHKETEQTNYIQPIAQKKRGKRTSLIAIFKKDKGDRGKKKRQSSLAFNDMSIQPLGALTDNSNASNVNNSVPLSSDD